MAEKLGPFWDLPTAERLARLAERRQEIASLAQELTYAEVAKKFGISASRVGWIVASERRKREGRL